jgi:hypothetical protein
MLQECISHLLEWQVLYGGTGKNKRVELHALDLAEALVMLLHCEQVCKENFQFARSSPKNMDPPPGKKKTLRRMHACMQGHCKCCCCANYKGLRAHSTVAESSCPRSCLGL